MQNFPPTILGVMVLAASSILPAEAQNVATCVQMQSSLERLDCYDNLFRGRLSAPAETKAGLKPRKAPSATPPKAGSEVSLLEKLITNSTGKTAKVQQVAKPKPTKPLWAVRQSDEIKLVSTRSQRVHRNLVGHKSHLNLDVYCKDNTTSIRLTFGGNIVASPLDTAPVRFKVDDKPPEQYQFSVSDDFKSVGLWSGVEAIPIIKSLLGGEELTVEGAPFFARPVKAGFKIHGLDHAIQPVRGACRW